MFKTYVRHLLEYNTIIWSPSTIKYIDKCEQIQKHFTKCIRRMWNIAYRDRLRMLNLESLEENRMKNDMICVYKMFDNLLRLNVDDFFEKCTFTTRGHVYKIRRPFRRLSLINT